LRAELGVRTVRGVRLSDWARGQGIHPKTGCRRSRAGTLPVPARPVPAGLILVEVSVAAMPAPGGVAVYAGVASHEREDDLERRVGRRGCLGWVAGV
jgi:putative resolvase